MDIWRDKLYRRHERRAFAPRRDVGRAEVVDDADAGALGDHRSAGVSTEAVALAPGANCPPAVLHSVPE